MKKRVLFITLICTIMIVVLSGCGSKNNWNDGQYDGTAEGMHGDVSVSIKIEDGKITDINVTSQNETAGVGDVAIEKIPQEIIDSQSTDVEVVSGASESSKAIVAAVEDALQKATK